MLTNRDWRMLRLAGVEADTLAALTGLTVAEVEAKLHPKPSPQPEARPTPMALLTRVDWLRSNWGRRLRA